MYSVYCCTCKITGMSYIGLTNNVSRRWNEHSCGARTRFGRAVRKYGRRAFHTKVLFRTADREKGFEKEREFIKRKGTRYPNGYNVTEGGLGHTGCVSSGMTGKRHTAATREKMCRSRPDQTGKNNPMWGTHLSPERKNQISVFMKGNRYGLGVRKSAGTIKKIRKASIGRKHSPETIEKMRLARMRYWELKRKKGKV